VRGVSEAAAPKSAAKSRDGLKPAAVPRPEGEGRRNPNNSSAGLIRRSPFGRPHLAWVPLVVEEKIAPDPLKVGFLGAYTEVAQAHDGPDLVEEFGLEWVRRPRVDRLNLASTGSPDTPIQASPAGR
jgi:hypothetical protein